MTGLHKYPSRREALSGLGGLAAAALPGAAWGQAPAALPLRATLLEHMGSVVPDVEAAARFHSTLFNPAIRTEQQPVPLRLYVDLNGGYLAFGSRPDEPRAFFDHFCALIADYDSEAVAARLRADGIEVPANWPAFGLFSDPDALGVQLVADPGGWFPTVIDAAPLVEGPPLVTPMGLGHVSLTVSDFSRSLDFYRRYFGAEGGTTDSGQVWFEMGDTNLVLTQAAEGVAPGIDHIGVKVAAFDVERVSQALADMGATVEPLLETPFGPILRFTDPHGLVLELELQEA